MNSIHKPRSGVAVLRPWPFGPPLRGRAPHHDAGTLAAPRASRHELRRHPATAPVGGLASPQFPGFVL